jgi:hypothetical protein
MKKVVPTLESIDPVTIARAGADVSGKEGARIQLNGTVSGAGTARWTAEKGAPCVFADDRSARTTITCADNGTYEVTLTGGRSSDSAAVTVTNAAPEITSVTSGKTSETGKVTRVRVKFTDAGTRDEHTCEIDWKDGGKPTAGKVTAGSCKAEHTYRTAGIFAPVITVTDDDGATASTTVDELVVYDRKAGSAIGDGSFTSPAGAFPAGPKLTGKADFSFTAKYGKSDTKPSGKVSLDFADAKLKFRSTSIEWLVVTGSEAVHQGYGTVNGKGGYLFRVTATDGPDTFKIKIWKKSTGTVVYENKPAAKTKGITIGGK